MVDTRNLRYVDEPVPELPAPGADVMVARSYRLPVELDRWITATAAEKGVKPSALVRDLIELGRSSYQDSDMPVSLAEVSGSLAALRSHPQPELPAPACRLRRFPDRKIDPTHIGIHGTQGLPEHGFRSDPSGCRVRRTRCDARPVTDRLRGVGAADPRMDPLQRNEIASGRFRVRPST
jgi:hypothetical protein